MPIGKSRQTPLTSASFFPSFDCKSDGCFPSQQWYDPCCTSALRVCISLRLRQNTFDPGTNAENMMYASNNGGVLVGTNGFMIDTGSGYSTPLAI